MRVDVPTPVYINYQELMYLHLQYVNGLSRIYLRCTFIWTAKSCVLYLCMYGPLKSCLRMFRNLG